MVTRFFFNAAATPDIYTLSLHDALPIWLQFLRQIALGQRCERIGLALRHCLRHREERPQDRKSTRLNSSHVRISYAVFCLKKKKTCKTKKAKYDTSEL